MYFVRLRIALCVVISRISFTLITNQFETILLNVGFSDSTLIGKSLAVNKKRAVADATALTMGRIT
jgi:hypothetical protein